MKNYQYTKSSVLSKSIDSIERIKKDILNITLSPKEELQLRWETKVDKIYYSLLLNNSIINKEHVIDTLSTNLTNKLSAQQNQILKLKNVLDILSQDWLGTDSSINKDTLELFCRHLKINISSLRINETEMQQVLSYIQLNDEHPIIQAGLAYIMILDLFSQQQNVELPQHIALLFLYKYGYDFRGMVSIERQFSEDRQNYIDNLRKAIISKNITIWLEYFTQAILFELKMVLKKLEQKKQEAYLPASFFELTDRQKDILSLLDNPTITISNKKLQEYFKVSQITASRDLAKLTKLGLLFAIGKGRSTYYTRV